RLARRPRHAEHAYLIRSLAIPRQRRQAQQSYALFTSAQADTTKGQNVPVEALRPYITQIGHTCELAFEPAPPARLAIQPRPVKQPAGQPVADPSLKLEEHSGLCRFRVLVFNRPNHFRSMPGRSGDSIRRPGKTPETFHTFEKPGA